MRDTAEQVGSTEDKAQSVNSTTDYGNAGAGIRLAEVEDSSAWEAYNRWRSPHE